jgi:Domain of unknown function (DUF4926)
MFKLLDVVALVKDIPELGLNRDQEGTILEIYNNGVAFEVDFVDDEGKTIALETIKSEYLKLIESYTGTDYDVEYLEKNPKIYSLL